MQMIGQVECKWVGKSVQLHILSNFRDLRIPTVHQALGSAVDGSSGLLVSTTKDPAHCLSFWCPKALGQSRVASDGLRLEAQRFARRVEVF